MALAKIDNSSNKIPLMLTVSTKTGVFMYTEPGGSLVKRSNDVKCSAKCLAVIPDQCLIGVENARRCFVVAPLKIETKKDDMQFFPVPGKVNAMAVSDFGGYCVAAVANALYIWTVINGNLMYKYEDTQEIVAVTFAYRDSYIVYGTSTGNVHTLHLSKILYDDTTKTVYSWTHHSSAITCIYTAANRVATTGLDQRCHFYSIKSGELLRTIYMEDSPTTVVMDTAGLNAVVGLKNGQLQKYLMTDCAVHPTITSSAQNAVHCSKTPIVCMAISPDGLHFAAASKQEIKLYDTTTMSCIRKIDSDGEVTNILLTKASRPMWKPDAFHVSYVVNKFSRTVDDIAKKNQSYFLPTGDMQDLPSAPSWNARPGLMNDGKLDSGESSKPQLLHREESVMEREERSISENLRQMFSLVAGYGADLLVPHTNGVS